MSISGLQDGVCLLPPNLRFVYRDALLPQPRVIRSGGSTNQARALRLHHICSVESSPCTIYTNTGHNTLIRSLHGRQGRLPSTWVHVTARTQAIKATTSARLIVTHEYTNGLILETKEPLLQNIPLPRLLHTTIPIRPPKIYQLNQRDQG